MTMENRSYSGLIAAALVAGVVALIVALIFRGGSGPHPEAAQQFAEIERAGELRVAYAVGAPLFVVDPNTRSKSGIFYEVVEGAAKRLGLRVNWNEEVGYGEMIEGLRADRYDLVGSGVWVNTDRAKGATFSTPIYYDAVYAYVRAGDRRFSGDLDRLNDRSFTISTMDGELGASIAGQSFPEARTLALPQNADFTNMIQNVVEGRADAVFLAAAAAREYQAANPGKLEAATLSRPVRVFPVAIMLPQGDTVLREALNAALMEMQNDGEIERILQRYEQSEGSFLRLRAPYRTPGDE